MIKLFLVIALTLSACTEGITLDATIVQSWDRTSELDVYVPSMGRIFSINSEDYANGSVVSDALTCPADTLEDLANGDAYPSVVPEIMRVTRVGGCADISDNGDALQYVECWTMKGCETLHNFDQTWMSAHGFTYTIEAPGNGTRAYMESDKCISDSLARNGSPDIDCELWDGPPLTDGE